MARLSETFDWAATVDVPDERRDPFWDDFLDDPPVVAYAAAKATE